MPKQHKDDAVPPPAPAPLPEPGLVLRVSPGKGALRRARDRVRALIAEGLPRGGVRVELEEGEYALPETLSFDARDSGTPYAPVVYRAKPGARVLFSGGVRLAPDAFAPLTREDPLFSRLPLPEQTRVADISAFGFSPEDMAGGFGLAYCGADSIAGQNRMGNNRPELFFRAAPLTPVRYPAAGYLRTARSVPGKDPAISFGVDDPRVRTWAEVEKTQLQGYFRYDWANAQVPVASFDRQSGMLRTVPAMRYGVQDGMRYYFLDVPEELREKGQYYLDAARGRLYLLPPDGFGEEPLYLSRTRDALLRFDGASHLVFVGIEFAYARGSGVCLFGGEGVTFAGCTFFCLGYKAAFIGCQTRPVDHRTDRVCNGGYGHALQSCDIRDTAFGGVYVSAGNRETLRPSGVRIENCEFERFARVGKCYFFAVEFSCIGSTVRNCRFHDSPHAAIWFDGNENVIEYNEFYDLLREADDAAAVYCGRDYTLQGNLVRYNFFHDMQSDAATAVSVFGTYCDDNTAGVAYYGNLYYRMQGAHHSHSGHDIHVENNLVVHGTHNSRHSMTLLRYLFPRSLTGEGEHVLTFRNAPTELPLWHARYPRLYEYVTWPVEEQVMPHYCVYRNNAIFSHLPLTLEEGVTDPALHNVIENNPVSTEDVGFVDEENMDLRLRPDSPVFRLLPDFIPIPFEKIGLYRDAYRP